MKRGDTEKAMYRVSELAKALQVHPATIRRWLVRDGVAVVRGRERSAVLIPAHEVRAHYPIAWYALQMAYNLKRI